jgi:RNA polymerase sigma-70 factor (ECF subfamily)
MNPVSDDPPAARPAPQRERDAVDLMRRAAAGDRAAFAALYEAFAKPVMSFVYHLTFDRALAEDLTQETFLRAWRAAPSYRPMGRFSTWLFQIAKNAAFSAGARSRRRRAREEAREPSETADRAARPADASARRDEVSSAVRDALARLSDRLRVAFTLVRLEGRSYAETAEVLGVPEGTVKSRMAAAEARLRARLGRFL